MSELDAAVAALERGEVIVFPTETVYGLGSLPDLPDAVDRIFELKGRPRDRVLQLLLPSPGAIDDVAYVPPPAARLIEAFMPGPLTLVLEARDTAPSTVVSGGSIGVRVPTQPQCVALLERIGSLASSSANRSGESPVSDGHQARRLFGDGVGAYIEGGAITGPSSTVVLLDGVEPVIRREGAISSSDIERAVKLAHGE